MPVRRYETAMDAHFAQGLLARRGIPAFVDGESTGTVWGIQVAVSDGIRLVVRAQDAASAEAVLSNAQDVGDETAAAADTLETPAAPAAAVAPVATEEEASLAADAWARRLRAFAVVLLPLATMGGWLTGASGPLLLLLPGFLLLVAVPLVVSRRIGHLSPIGRRHLVQARVAVGVVTLLWAALMTWVVVWAFIRR